MEHWPAYESKMKAEGLSDAAINAFKYNFEKLTSGESLFIPESSITAVESLPTYESLTKEDPSLLGSTVMLKLNGGLGTGMGLEKAKSLLPLKDGATFLDFIAQQVELTREKFKVDLAFMLMNSFSTSADTLAYLSKYPKLALDATGLPLEFQQNKAPKVTKEGLAPASWPAAPSNEWCPPGHGDLYPALVGSGMLDQLVAKGYKYMFVSNSDNLGATMDLKLLTWFAESGADFAMEAAARTDADKKGGHLANKAGGGLLLRESAQCPDADEGAFQDVTKHKFFNTNNLWVNLAALKATFEASGGVLKLPVIKNGKTVDPRDKASTKVLQLETAMGSAIECFAKASAILIPRTRFAPVKTTNDLLALSSDAYEVTADKRMVLKAERNGTPPDIKLDGMYKFVDQLATLVPPGCTPSLIKCDKLTVKGAVVLEAGVVFEGKVEIVGAAEGPPKVLKAGTYKDKAYEL
jgi:UDP-N-acetylglucosamine pyrophosphorylase